MLESKKLYHVEELTMTARKKEGKKNELTVTSTLPMEQEEPEPQLMQACCLC